MFNNTQIKISNPSPTVVFNQPCTGTLQKSHPCSTFIRFQIDSGMEDAIFPSNGETPYMHIVTEKDKQKIQDKYGYGSKIEIIVLQVLLFGNSQYLVEVVEPKFLEENLLTKQ